MAAQYFCETSYTDGGLPDTSGPGPQGGTVSKEEFDAIDADGDGYITASELMTSLGSDPKISVDDIVTILQMADENGDQKLSYEEYAKFAR